jgi:hypothetical protein
MKRVSSSLKLAVAVLLLTPLAALMPGVKPAYARKMIIEMVEWIEPVATLSPNGRHIKIGLGARAREYEDGAVAHVVVRVHQDQTGAVGIGFGKAAEAAPNDPPEVVEPWDVHAIGRPRFVEGPAVACYQVEVRRKGKVIDRVSHCDEIVLETPAPALTGPIRCALRFDPETGQATLHGLGLLNLMGLVQVRGELQFIPGAEPGSLDGVGVMAFRTLDGELLVSNVVWYIDADGNGDLEFRWPKEITFRDGTTVASTGPFVDLPFGGLRGISIGSPALLDVNLQVRMTGEIIDPDPLD